MSLNKLTHNTLTTPPAPNYAWMNIGCNTLSTTNEISTTGGINLNDTGLTNVSSINGAPVSSLGSMNVIYRPTAVTESNIFGTWSALLVVVTSSNQTIDIYFDNSLSSPC